MNSEKKEFKIFKLSIEQVSIIYGSFLMIWGIVISYLSDSSSFTSYIPSLFGILILIFAILSMTIPKKQKILMHIVVIFGLLIFIAGFDLLLGLAYGSDPFSNFWASLTRLMFLITSSIFCFFCIQSFRFARKSRS